MGILLGAEPVVGVGTMTSAVLVATNRRPEPLRRMLASLAAADRSNDLDEIFVVENGVREGASDVVAETASLLPVRYDFIERANKSAALNHALQSCRADLLIFFDDDVWVASGTVQTYLEAASRYGPGHFFGGPVRPRYDADAPQEWLRDVLPTCTTGFDLGANEQSCHEFLGANWAAFRQDLVAVRGFSSGLGPGSRAALIGQETEAQRRMIAEGSAGVFLPGAVVEHRVPQDHLTIAWARRRRYRQKLAQTLLAGRPHEGPTIAGAPRYLWRSVAEQYVRVLRDRLVRPRTKTRARSEMLLAGLRAELRAHQLRSRVGAIGGGDLPGT